MTVPAPHPDSPDAPLGRAPLRVPPRRKVLVALGLLAAGALGGALVSRALRPPAHAAAPPAHAARPPSLSPDPAQLERLGVRFAPVARGASESTVDVVGQLELNRERLAEVSTHAAGRVAAVLAVVGQRVRRGQVLAQLESPAIGEAAALYQVRTAELRTARQQLTRLRDLDRQGLTTRRELEVVEGQARSAEAELGAARTRLAAFGVSPGSMDGRTGHAPLIAPIDGEVIRREIVLGSWVEPQAEAFAVADLSNLWAQLDVFEGDLASIAPGDVVQLDVPSLGLRDLRGEVQHVYAELDPRTRVGKVRVVVPNPTGQLRAGLTVAAHVRPRGRPAALVLPVEGVRQRDGRPHVLVRRGNAVAWVPVETGARRGADVEITRGLAEGEQVAVSGVGLLAEPQ